MHEQQSPELSTHSHPPLVVVEVAAVVVVVVVCDARGDEEQLPLPQDIHDRRQQQRLLASRNLLFISLSDVGKTERKWQQEDQQDRLSSRGAVAEWYKALSI